MAFSLGERLFDSESEAGQRNRVRFLEDMWVTLLVKTDGVSVIIWGRMQILRPAKKLYTMLSQFNLSA